VLAFAAAMCALAANPPSDLQRGTELFEQYKYAEARAAFAKARNAPNLTRADLLDLLEMTGVAAAQQRQPEAAQNALIELITLDPDHKLKNDYAPRVMTPFFEARRIVGERGALQATSSAEMQGERVERITVSVIKDPMRYVRTVRFHLQTDSGWTTTSAPFASATFDVKQPEARWWAELLGNKDAQLFLLGTADAPRVDAAPKPVAEVAEVTPPPPAPEPPVQVEQPSGGGGGGVRSASYVIGAVALLAAGAGGFFGWRASADYAHVTNAQNNGGVLALTEHDAYAFVSAGQQSAMVANGLFITAGALAVTALLMWLLGAP
jgi:hypothetical protein